MLISIFSFFSVILFSLDFLFLGWFIVSFFLVIYYYTGGAFDGLFFVDYLSLVLVFVLFWVFVLSFLTFSFSGHSVFVFLVIFFTLLMSFFTISGFYFYCLFEFSFILMFFFLLGWGNTYERFQASFYIFFYTLFFSLPFLFFIFDLYTSFFHLTFFSMGYSVRGSYLIVFVFLVFSVNLPLMGFHLWLPKAHVESPVGGSMVLAGVLLKLGGYGIMRFSPLTNFFFNFSSYFYTFLFYLSMYGAVVICVVCLTQIDLKVIIAYSSVVHISLMMVGCLSFSSWGVYGAILIMVSHGFISPLMFFLITHMYDLLHSRSVMVLNSFFTVNPLLCLLWFICCVLNVSVPPFISFYSEVSIVGSLSFLADLFDFFLLFSCCFFTGIYCIFLYVMVSHGSNPLVFFNFLDVKTLLVGFSHVFYVLIYPVVFFL